MDFTQIFGDFSVSVSVISIILSIISCFYGYKLFKFFIKVYGFIAFALIGATVFGFIGLSGGAFTIGVLIAGILGAFLGYKFYKFTLFVIVAVSAFAVINAIIPIWIISFMISMAIGSLSLFFVKPVICITTASSSAMFIASSIGAIIVLPHFVLVAIYLLFTIFGSLKQLKS